MPAGCVCDGGLARTSELAVELDTACPGHKQGLDERILVGVVNQRSEVLELVRRLELARLLGLEQAEIIRRGWEQLDDLRTDLAVGETVILLHPPLL